MTTLVAFDFESEEISPFPEYPPKPTMLGIYAGHQEPIYLSWGHPTGNNCTEEDARHYLKMFWDNPDIELIAHNLSFDTAIAVKHWGFDLFRKGPTHDTMVQAFLLDPHARTIALKPLGEKYLDMAPTERDEVLEWLVANGVCRETKDWGKHISKAPGDIVGPYCVGDVVRTMELYKKFKVLIDGQCMDKAYNREMALVFIMIENTLDGVRVDVPRLTNDIAMYNRALVDVETLLFKYLECEPFNVDSDAVLADSIDRVHPGLEWIKTPKGKRSTSKANMEITLSGISGYLGALLQYRASVATCVHTFMEEWLRQAVDGNGRMRCQWNTTRSDNGGARTGRLSSTPSLMNIPTLTSAKFQKAIALHLEFISHLPSLPNVRSYILADSDDDMLISLDYSAQELRVLGHMEGGAIQQAYVDNPKLDMHEFAAALVSKAIGKTFSRKYAKTVAFSILYGSGLKALAAGLGVSVDLAQEIRSAYLEALPGIAELQDALKARARQAKPIRTWGGRVYYCEEPKFMEGRWRTFEYKLLNYLIQGSSADLTKQAMVDYHKVKQHGRLLLTVHDQIVISCPKTYWEAEAGILRRAMEDQDLGAPLIADISYGPDLHNVVDYDASL